MNHLCQNVAPIPLLWVLPLATYLLTFILCFDRQGSYKPVYVRWLLPLALGVMAYSVFDPSWPSGATSQIALYLGCLFVACLFCHGELARLKPHSRYLTSFYLIIALGGALASLAIGLVAPRISSWQVEFPETLVCCGILALPALYPKHRVRQAATLALVATLCLLAVGLVRARRPGTVSQARSFYGVLTVTEEQITQRYLPTRMLYHGAIQHGSQILVPQLQGVPTAYYGPQSGVGLILRARRTPRNVGVIGLGAGTLAIYGRPVDSFTFYEIDPLVSRIAHSDFTYLAKSRARLNVVIGDGRLSLEKSPPERFNLLVVDAFSGDSIPVHLLTREAFDLYFSKLTADGAIAIHITNNFVDLKPVLARVSETLHKPAMLVRSPFNSSLGAYYSEWVLIANDAGAFRDLPPASLQTLPPAPPGFELWTDDYSNVLELLK
jgi:hypothetical protein